MRELILVVDDEEPIQLLLSECLNRAGYKAVAAHTATDATMLLQQVPFSLVILDLVLPDTTGFEFMRQIKRQYHGVAVVILTGMDYEEDVLQAALRAGADAFVSKFVTVDLLISEIHRVLKKRRDREASQSINPFPPTHFET
jgi:two-component system OmpR family response regulator